MRKSAFWLVAACGLLALPHTAAAQAAAVSEPLELASFMSVPPTAHPRAAAAKKKLPVSMGGAVALTFDDGPDPHLTPRLLDILRAEGVTATFCLVGRNVADYPHIVRQMLADGHELCNHSWNHHVLTSGNVAREIARTDAAIEAATGTTPAMLRAPYGELRHVGSCYLGRPFVGWDTDTMDWKRRNVAYITQVASGTRPDAIVLMHDIHKTSVAAVPGIIRALKARGVRFTHASALWRHRCGARTAGK